MNCPIQTGEGTELFLDYASHSLPEDKVADLELHMASCADCMRVATAQRTLWNTLDSWQPPPIAEDFDQRLYARIAQDGARPWYRRWFDAGNLNWPVRPAMPVGAACAALLAAFLFRDPVFTAKQELSVQSKHVDIEQVERALDDIDMLNQLGVMPPVSKPAGKPESM